MKRQSPSIGKGAIITACELLKGIQTNGEVETLLLEYGLSDYVQSEGSIAKTILSLKKYATENPDHIVATDYGEKTLSIVIIEEAIKRIPWSHGSQNWPKLERYLNLDGYAFLKEVEDSWDGQVTKITGITIAMPDFAELPKSMNEVDFLLKKNGFDTVLIHLASAKDNIAQADWVAANSQCRTFLEALTDAIADTLYQNEAASKKGGLEKRHLLAAKGFLSRDKCEFGDGNGQAFLPGLANLLNKDGSHPGASTQYDAMFRLQLVVVTAQWLLRKLEIEKNNAGHL